MRQPGRRLPGYPQYGAIITMPARLSLLCSACHRKKAHIAAGTQPRQRSVMPPTEWLQNCRGL
jgi:hypothetical protein